ncbi:FAD-binding protein [candidate division KSB1 bacterium]|nr:FAD-binding protein [candidate division KSB1 bacterium]
MTKSKLKIKNVTFPLYSLNTLIIGSGAASLNTAIQLHEKGQTDLAIATDQWGGGTSNNTGSDKQTYYKMSLAGDVPDSPVEMAKDLFNGGCMHGDIALCEAQQSAQAFYNLVTHGVPFPHNRYGAYIGYKTDHDPRARATSCGPLTSHLMFKHLANVIKLKRITVFDLHEIIALLTATKDNEKHVVGAIALDRNNLQSENLGFVIFNAVNVVLGTGGPAGIYKTSVYPESQTGSSGLGYKIGAIGNNLTESQYGIASIKFRWNLSGTYQQVIPRYISTDEHGNDEQEFLNHYFPDMGKLSTAIFLKGYQWPFDPRKVFNYGSSLIDILVYQETMIKARRVFIDFTKNPTGEGLLDNFSFDDLASEAYSYLENSGALFGTPIQRLQHMNQSAIDLYQEHGIDITKEPLEIAVCAQHNNGGLKGNIWWESNIKHLFPVGEANGTHGVYRPGGSALNSGQVGSMRAALFISKRYANNPPDTDEFVASTASQINGTFTFAANMINPDVSQEGAFAKVRDQIQVRMSTNGAHIRDIKNIKEAVKLAWQLYARLNDDMKISSATELPDAFKNLDICLVHAIYLEAISEYLQKGGQSRGSYLVRNENGAKPCQELDDYWRLELTPPDAFVNQKILEIRLNEQTNVVKQWIDIRPIPQQDLWFENAWKAYFTDKIIG